MKKQFSKEPFYLFIISLFSAIFVYYIWRKINLNSLAQRLKNCTSADCLRCEGGIVQIKNNKPKLQRGWLALDTNNIHIFCGLQQCTPLIIKIDQVVKVELTHWIEETSIPLNFLRIDLIDDQQYWLYLPGQERIWRDLIEEKIGK
jgi:hypothetical protein